MRGHTGRLTGFSMLILSLATSAAAADLRVVDAMKRQDRAAVRVLVTSHADVNAPEPDGATALHWAAHWDDLDSADVLLRAGAHVNAANDLGVTSLYLACTNRNAAMVERLLAAGANPNAALPSGETALMTASRTGGAEAVRALLAHGADVNGREPIHGETALMWAVAYQHPTVVRTLIEAGGNIEARSAVRHRRIQVGMRFSDHDARTTAYADLGGFTPLLFAARHGDVESATLLLAAGANVNDASPFGQSALVVAAHSGHGAFAAFLLDKGADPNADAGGCTALHAAVLRGDATLLKTLLARGANPNLVLTKGTPVRYVSQDYAFNVAFLGATPYWLAARFGEPGMMRLLAAAGADTRRAIKDGSSPLLAALTATGNLGAVGTTSDRRERVLTPTELAAIGEGDDERVSFQAATVAVALGADVNAPNQNGDTPLHAAAARGYTTIVKDLLDKGAEVSAVNKAGDTPLHNAASRAFTGVIQLLADKGASLEAKNNKGQTPLTMTTVQVGIGGASFISAEHRKAAADLLKKLGAKE